MRKSLVIIFVLMSLCVAGITALQLYYSYTNYRLAQKTFAKEANEALLEAHDSSIMVHNRRVEDKFRQWMNDTSFVKITSRWNPEQKVTLFTIRELKPIRGNGQVEISMSIDEITERIDSITPEKKKLFIEHMVQSVDAGLKKGTVWFFTQGLGDRLSEAYYKTPIDIKIINEQYRQALKRRGITLPFSFGKSYGNTDYCTGAVNMSVDKERWMKACFSGVDTFLLGKLRWVITGSLLLIVITLACFWYTARTLLSQHKLSQMKDDFISNMTHEIHTPLASLLVTAEALKKFSHDEASRESYIDIILHQGYRLAALTDEILNGARLDKKGIPLEDAIEMNALIVNIISAPEYSAVEFEPSTGRIEFRGNALHLGNALRNLFDNALKYNTDPKPEVKVRCGISGRELTIYVTDNGPGISDSQKEKVFAQFYRIPSGNVHNVKGYGLGLSYVKKVVEAHRGTIHIKNNYPSGSIFIMKLPL